MGAVVTSTRSITIDEITDEPDYNETMEKLANEYHPSDECIQYYGYEIITDKGSAKLEFRNSSNGYYGGSMTASKVG